MCNVQSFGWRLATAPDETLSDAEVRAMMEKERNGGGGAAVASAMTRTILLSPTRGRSPH